MKLKHAFLIILLVLIIDQWSKIYIKTHFILNEAVTVFSWFQIYFVENEGAAWGTKIPGEYGKLILTLFRIIAVIGIGYWLVSAVRKQQPKILIICISLILAGALGNIIDSVFYGIILVTLLPYLPKILTELSCTAKWWICSTFLLSILHFPAGYPFGEANAFVSSSPCSMWLTLQYV